MTRFDEDYPNHLTEKRKRSNHKLPQIKDSNGRYQIIGTWKGNRYYVSTGLAVSPRALKRVEKIRASIQADIESGLFDDTLDRYYGATGVKRRTKKPETQQTRILDLQNCWDMYVTVKSKVVEQTTIEVWYRIVGDWVEKVTNEGLTTAKAVREYMERNTTPQQAVRVLRAFQTAIAFCVARGEQVQFHLKGEASLVAVPKGKRKPPTAYDDQQTSFIIREIQYKWGMDAGRFTEFCFLTGCRTSEAIALRWKHIRWNSEIIMFEGASVEVSERRVIEKGTKTATNRAFPMTPKLYALLKEVLETGSDEHVFTYFGSPISRSEYSDKWFRSAVNALNQCNKSEIKGTGYNTRSTFITRCLRKGMPVADVAKLVGNSPQTIYKHYAGTTDKLDLSFLE